MPESVENSVISGSYSSLRTGIIRLTPESLKCKLYCRGSLCKYCTHTEWTPDKQAIKGLYSTWITPEIMAMARPTQNTFVEFHFLETLSKVGIKTIFNLQRGGEHAFCGPPLLSSGFTYEPELIMKNKVYYYNFAIPDFGTSSSVSALLDVIKVMAFALKNGKIAIHCHAGLGRTGTVIASYMVWSLGLKSIEAVHRVRLARPNALQSQAQVEAVEQLAETLCLYATALPNTIISGTRSSRFINNFDDDDAVAKSSIHSHQKPEECFHEKTLESKRLASHVQSIALSTLLTNQRAFLPNEEARRFSHIPKLLYHTCDRLLRVIFEEEGVVYTTQQPSQTTPHNVRNCTFGRLSVEWRNAFTLKGRAQVRCVVNLLARLITHPQDNSFELIAKFQGVRLLDVEERLQELDAPQLVFLLNACMESIRRPYSTKSTLIQALRWFSPVSHEDLNDAEFLNIEEMEAPESVFNISVNNNNNNRTKEHKVDLNATWHCTVFYTCNVLSYLCGENYDIVVELITYWLMADNNSEVHAAVYAHMRDLFARNMRQQEQQASQLRKCLFREKEEREKAAATRNEGEKWRDFLDFLKPDVFGF